MLTRIAELSDLIGLSKVSIYRKLKLEELKPHIVKDKGITYLTEEGVKIIKKSFSLEDRPLKDEIYESTENKGIEEIKEQLNNFNNNHLNSLNLEIESLKKQLNEKDKQISEKDRQIADLHKLIENTQVLFKYEQEKETKQLQQLEHFQKIDEKLMELKEKLNHKEEPKKGFFGRLKK